MEKDLKNNVATGAICPKCYCSHTKKCGTYINKTNKCQRYQCKQCSRTFIPNGQDFFVSEEKRQFIYNSLGERSSLAGISRIFGVSKTWLLTYIKEVYINIPDNKGFKYNWLVGHRIKKNAEFIIQNIEK